MMRFFWFRSTQKERQKAFFSNSARSRIAIDRKQKFDSLGELFQKYHNLFGRYLNLLLNSSLLLSVSAFKRAIAFTNLVKVWWYCPPTPQVWGEKEKNTSQSPSSLRDLGGEFSRDLNLLPNSSLLPSASRPLPSLKWLSLFLVGIFLNALLGILPAKIAAQTLPAPPTPPNECTSISNPLTPEEEIYARASWQYFLNNYQPATGLVNAAKDYPSGTLWDQGNYLMALNAARWLNLIDPADFDYRLNQFLTTLSNLKRFEDILPNKVYNTATAQMVDYVNTVSEKGIGWSALDVGRLLAALHVIRTCHPQYGDWIQSILKQWKIETSIKDGEMMGATMLENGNPLRVQEGRMGYEEYAARGYEIWGFKPSKAISLEPFMMVKIDGLEIPVDRRDYQKTQANNYVVSESYILEGIEFGLPGVLADYAARVLEVQKRRFEATGQLTAVSEDNIDKPPHFLYNTVYANGVAWATITDANQPYPDLRTLSTKAAIGWYYLYPDNPYTQQLMEVAKGLRSPDGDGFYAGLYEKTKEPNKILTSNTNGLILETLYYKARGNRPLIGSNLVSASTGNPDKVVEPEANGDSTPDTAQAPSIPEQSPTPPAPEEEKETVIAPESQPPVVAIKPIPSVGNPRSSKYFTSIKPLSVVERRYGEAAWAYFKTNYQENTGLVSDRSDLKGATLWGLGDYLAALQAARALDIITPEEFDRRTRMLLSAIAQFSLFTGELPQRGYDTKTLQPVDYGGNPTPEGTGFSALDVGRMLAELYNLKSCHPEYTEAVDRIALDWSYLRAVRDGMLASAIVEKDSSDRPLTRVNWETRLGYEEYAARGFQLWGFDVGRAAVGGEYQTEKVEGIPIPTQRKRSQVNSEVNEYTVSNPFLLYGLEFGFDPQMREMAASLLKAETKRHQRTGKYSASATTLIDQEPYVIHSTLIGRGKPWATLGGARNVELPKLRMVGTATAFAYHALFPDDAYAQELWQAITDLYRPLLGFYEGFYEETGKTVLGFTGETNSLILQSLLYQASDRQPIVHESSERDSPWWQAVREGNSGQGLPNNASPTAQLTSDASGTYWVSASVEKGRGQRAEGRRKKGTRH